MGPAPEQAWRSAALALGRFSSLSAMADLAQNANELPSCSIAVCCEAGAVQAALQLCSLPDFDHTRFEDPWRAAASKRSSSCLRLLRDFGVPSSGWKRRHSFDNRTPWTELAQAKWILDISLKECSNELTLAGCPATSEDLASALKTKRFFLADAIEATGAAPDKACFTACLAASKNEEDEFVPDTRLIRWMQQGSIDILSPELCSPTESRYGTPKDFWLASYAKACTASKPESKADACCVFFDCLARSRSLEREGPAALKRALQQRTFGKNSHSAARWIATASLEASKAKGMPPPEFTRHGDIEAPTLFSWLEAFALRSLPEAPTAFAAKKRNTSL